MDKAKVNICWLRRDLRIHDQRALAQALQGPYPVLPIFIFDTQILDRLEDKQDARLSFLHQTLGELKEEFRTRNAAFLVLHGQALTVFQSLQAHWDIQEIYCNHDYESYALERDGIIKAWASGQGIAFHSFKDQVIFEKDEVLSNQGSPYTVFTPYSRKWKERFQQEGLVFYPSESLHNYQALDSMEPWPMPSLASIGFQASSITFPSKTVNEEVLRHYGARRDIPSLDATSRLSVHLRFGTISIRQLVAKAQALDPVFLNELIWRDFYFNITHHFPHIGQGKAFRLAYDNIQWVNNEAHFEAWCQGKTGYPLVDAGMRQLNATGFMHNRVRMVVASFLVKHLQIDWRWGEAYFAKKLLDFDFSANNGGWQWAAGSGCDAAPYFRVFNPRLQTEKFDPKLTYIRKWVPEFQSLEYPQPIVQHEIARNKAIAMYQAALKAV